MLVCCPGQCCGTISRNLFWISKMTAIHNRCLLKFKLFASFQLSFGVWVKVMQYYDLHVSHICMSINYHLIASDMLNRLPWNMVFGWVLLKYVDTIQFICYNERNITNLCVRACAHIHFFFLILLRFSTEALSICF
jgi:hypothetical protein